MEEIRSHTLGNFTPQGGPAVMNSLMESKCQEIKMSTIKILMPPNAKDMIPHHLKEAYLALVKKVCFIYVRNRCKI